MRIEIREAESSTSERPLWLWRVWCNGRMSQGFSPTERDASNQAKLEAFAAELALPEASLLTSVVNLQSPEDVRQSAARLPLY